jgi:hypothetical protein
LNRQLGKGIPVMSLSKKEYIQLLFIAKDWFEQNGYKYISFILIGKPDSNQSLKKNITRGKTLLEITDSSVYKSISNRYSMIGGEKVSPNTILAFVAEIVNTEFEFYKMPDGKFYAIESMETRPSLRTVIVELLTYIDSL